MSPYQTLLASWHRAHLLDSISGVLGWDQQTVLPPLAAAHRGEQMGFVAQLSHHELTSDAYRQALEAADAETVALPALDGQRRNVERAKRSLQRQAALPPALVKDLNSAAVTGQTAWEEAKRRRDFKIFEEPLTRVIALSREKARVLGYLNQPYDGLLPDFEWGVDTKQLDAIFTPLQKGLSALLDQVRAYKDVSFTDLGQGFDATQQEMMGQELALAFGFSFEDGLLLTSAHPFSTTLGPRDFRITTRYVPEDFLSSFSAVAHEVGHSLYERGLPADWAGQPIGNASSAGIHESQSLFWEKRIAQSRPFLKRWLKRFQAAFPGQLEHLKGDELFRVANRVRPSLIRVDADEVTYSLHIIIRFEIEKALINDGLAVADIPALWNEKYRHYLGIEPAHVSEGCLQDVHWSCGAFGYFPSYALGHLFSAQFSAAMERDIGSLDAQIEADALPKILGWLRTHIHSQGALFDSMDLVKKVTGQPLSIDPFLRAMQEKIDQVYGSSRS